MAIAVDASSPARVDKPGTASAVSTTASFDPPASVLVVCCSGDGTGQTFSISNNGTPLIWTEIALRNSADSGGLSSTAQAFQAVLSAGRTGMTVTATYSQANDTSFKTYVVTDANTSDPVGGSAEGSTQTANLTTTAFSIESANSLGFALFCDFDATGNATSSDMTLDAGTIAGQISFGSGYKTLGAAGSGATFNVQMPSNPTLNWVSFEIQAATAGGTVSASTSTALHPGAGPTRSRFATTPRDTSLSDIRLSGGDSATTTDSASIAATVSDADTATLSDTASLLALLSDTDSAGMADSASVFVVPDSVVASTPTVLHPGRGPTRARFAATPRATDASSTVIVASDSAALTESAESISATLTTADTASATDTASVLATATTTDSAAASEAATVAVTGTVTDTGSLADSATISATLTATDNAALSETASVAAILTDSDTAALTDSASLAATSAIVLGSTSTSLHPGRGPSLTRLLISRRSADVVTAPPPAYAWPPRAGSVTITGVATSRTSITGVATATASIT